MAKFSDKFERSMATLANTLPQLALQSAYKLPNSNTAFRINASYSKPSYNMVEADFSAMVSDLFEKKFALVENSLQHLPDQRQNAVFSALVEANVAVKDYDEKNIRQTHKVLSANVFVDDEDAIWRVVDNNGTKQLVQSINEDFGKLIASRIARLPSQVIASNFPGMVPTTGDYLYYYNTENRALQSGFALIAEDGIQVVDRISHKPVTISASNIVEIVEGNSLDTAYSLASKLKEHKTIVADDVAVKGLYQNYLDYARNLFSGTPYYNKLEELIGKKVRQAIDIKPVMQNRLVVERN